MEGGNFLWRSPGIETRRSVPRPVQERRHAQQCRREYLCPSQVVADFLTPLLKLLQPRASPNSLTRLS